MSRTDKKEHRNVNTPDGYEQAAMKAVQRWKENQTPQLKDQIIATWRMAKEHWAESKSMQKAQLQKIWQDTFRGIPGWDFDFTKDDQNTF